MAYTLDNAGNRTRETATGALTAATPVATTAYGYDPVGNRMSVTTGGTARYAAYDNANRLCWDNGATSGTCATPTTGATTYANDNAGNRTGRTAGGVTTTYAYDAANRLKTVSSGTTTTATYAYDGDGYRVKKVVGSATTTYAWDRLGAGGLGAVVGDGAAEYAFGPAGLQQRTASATSQYAQGDGLGSVRLITDGAGNAAGAASFEPWGAPKGGSATLGGFGYAGEQTDAETGFVYLRARHYDPATGRFVQQDPLGLGGGSTNLCAYAGDNPTMFTDPSGLFPTLPVVSCIAGGAAGAVIGFGAAVVVAAGTGGAGGAAAPAIIAGGAVGGCALGAGLAVAGQNVYNSRSTTVPTAPTATPIPSRGTIDQSARSFPANELRIAEYLANQGACVTSLLEDHAMPGRSADANVNGARTEFKSLGPGADSSTIRNDVNASIRRGGQARNIVIDARGSGLTVDEARRGLARIGGFEDGRLDNVQIIGDGYDLNQTYPAR